MYDTDVAMTGNVSESLWQPREAALHSFETSLSG